MSTKTNTTGKATVTGSTVRPGLRVGKQVVAVQFGVWGRRRSPCGRTAAAAVGERPTSPSASGPARDEK